VKATTDRALCECSSLAKVIALSHDIHCAYLRLPHWIIDTSLEGLIEAIRGPCSSSPIRMI
jgi:hypothetical protein